MNTNNNLQCTFFDLSFRQESNYEEITMKSRQVKPINAVILEDEVDHYADPITSKEVINHLVKYWFAKKQYFKVAMFIFGINTGLRISDIISLRVMDIMNDIGVVKDGIIIQEKKTQTGRTVYFNDAVKIMLQFIVNYHDLSPEDFVFQSDGKRASYFLDFLYDESGNIVKAETTGEKYDVYGNVRLKSPTNRKTVWRWYKEINDICGIDGHFTSHSHRQTFSYFISTSEVNNVHRDVELASAALCHANVSTTRKHYSRVDKNIVRQATLSINLGYEALVELIPNVKY